MAIEAAPSAQPNPSHPAATTPRAAKAIPVRAAPSSSSVVNRFGSLLIFRNRHMRMSRPRTILRKAR